MEEKLEKLEGEEGELWGREVAEQVQAEYLLRTQREMERAEAEGVRLKERRALLGSRGLATQP